MNALERRYRAVIRWYPREWRERNGEALLGTLLDAADAEARTTTTLRELAALRIRALATRLDLVAPAWLRSTLATVLLGVGTSYGILTALFGAHGIGPWLTGAAAFPGESAGMAWSSAAPGLVAALILIAALTAAMLGGVGVAIARLAAVGVLVLCALLPPFRHLIGVSIGPDLVTLAFLAGCAAAVAAGAPRAGWPAPVAMAGSAVLFLALAAVDQRLSLGPFGGFFAGEKLIRNASPLVVTTAILIGVLACAAAGGARGALVAAFALLPWYAANAVWVTLGSRWAQEAAWYLALDTVALVAVAVVARARIRIRAADPPERTAAD